MLVDDDDDDDELLHTRTRAVDGHTFFVMQQRQRQRGETGWGRERISTWGFIVDVMRIREFVQVQC